MNSIATTTWPDAMERPTGRFDRVPSRVSGRTLTYFSPDPFPQLLSRYAGSSAGDSTVTARIQKAPAAMILVRGALGFRSQQSRSDEARAFIEVLSGRSPLRSGRQALLSLGLSAAHAPRRLRREVAFSGARVASDGHVFAHEEDVDPLFDSLCAGLAAPPARVSATVLAACAAFHALHVHPFADGNGRWTRMLAAWIGTTKGAVASGVLHACLLQLGKPMLVERHWPHARSHGLGGYLARCGAFESRAIEDLDASGLPDAMAAIHAGIAATVVSPILRVSVLADLIAHGRIRRVDIRRVACLSTRALDGALHRMAEHSGCEIVGTTGDLNASPLMTHVDDVLATALRASFQD